MVVTRTEVHQMLTDWERGHLSAAEVHDWAERRYAVAGNEAEDGVVNQVLALLDMLDVNLTVAADTSALRRLLEARPDGLNRALNEYQAYTGTIDVSARKRELSRDPLYGPFCRDGGVE
jgi:hypothetical protein